MPRGYRRGRVAGCGAGAAERLRSAIRGLDSDGAARHVGEVRQVFDRSAYVAFAREALPEPGAPGPPLVLLAGEGFDGPLSVRLDGSDPGGFAPDGLTPGDACRLRSRDAGYVLGVGASLDVAFDRAALEVPAPTPPQVGRLASLATGSAPHRRATAMLELLAGEGLDDGLGWLAELRGIADGEPPAGDIGELVDWWTAAVAGEVDLTSPATGVLGRGPGATPSGDDVVAGLVLALERSLDGERRRRVVAAADATVEAAAGRTTDVSAALLAQAARGRAAGRIQAAVGALLTPEADETELRSAVLAAAVVGHTSGVDHLVGAAIVPLAIGPRLAAQG